MGDWKIFSACGIAISAQHDFDSRETFANEDFDLASAAIKICVTKGQLGR